MKYFVTIKDEYGKKIELEVSAEIFKVFDDDRRLKERQRNEARRHYDKRGAKDYIIANESPKILKSAEDVYIDREAIAEILAMCTPTQRRRFCLNKIYGYSCAEIAKLEGCTPTQRRRFCLNKIYGYSCAEIAKLEGCAKNVVVKSVAAVMKKIQKKK